jgi:CheY-like chemotaxis protein
MTAASFQDARALLASITPEIVITDVKLEAYNGLHLAALCAVWRPETPFIVTDESVDPVLEADAKRLKAVFVVKTAEREELTQMAAALCESRYHKVMDVRRSYRKAAAARIVAEVASSSAEVLDVSYGGVALKLPTVPQGHDHEPPDSFDIVFPDLDLALHAERIWASPEAPGGWLCGADISGNDLPQLQRWREFVDSID